MNGRIYDPTIGRFLQADPIIQDPYNTQSLNRYSYVMNNPLSYTDPTGYSRLRKGAGLQIFQMGLSVALGILTSGATSALLDAQLITLNQAVGLTALAGAASGAVATGSLNGAVKGGIFAAISFGIGHVFKGFDGVRGIGEEYSASRIFAHALVSGVSAEVDGGSFGHGFAAAVLSQNIGKNEFFHKGGRAGRIVSNAILQGTISEATGGKFANGAMSAAFRVAFNDAFGGLSQSKIEGCKAAGLSEEACGGYKNYKEGTQKSLQVVEDVVFDPWNLADGVGKAAGWVLKGGKWVFKGTNLASASRTKHILYGDSTGGGHKFGLFRLFNGKTKFPMFWSEDKIMHHVSDIATDPSIQWIRQSGPRGSLFQRNGRPARFMSVGERDGAQIKVIIEPAGEGIITAFPLK